ncbi:MAG: SDR family oxidoreductase [Puniceicoccales bacterium]
MTNLHSLMDLSGRRALITGAAGGLGRTMADSLAELGADLILVDLDDRALQQLAEDLTERHSITATSLACDLEHSEAREALAQTVLNTGGLSVLVNNAAFVGTSGLTGWAEPFERQSVETWRRAVEVNLTSVFHLSQLFASALKEGPGGSVINIASIYGQWGPDWSLYEDTNMANPAAYGASKGGLIQFTRWLATTLAPDVRVNAISPGGVSRGQPQSFVSRYEARTPLGRMATEDDFRGAMAYLASDLSAYVTGQILAVDGGWGVW